MGRSSRLALSLLCGSLLMCGNSFEAGGDGGPGGDDSGSSSGGADSGSSSGGGSGGSSGSSSGGGSGGGSGGSSGGDDSGSVEGGGPWTPAMLPGLVVWLDDTKGVVASTTIKGAITRWLDQSGAGNDATPTNTQGAAGSNFTVDPAVVHGHDAILCPGNGTYLDVPDAITLRFGT
ncbi:MAG TPA: hypothetical protein VIF15_07890, partial [Polyangiaceae bacterium]